MLLLAVPHVSAERASYHIDPERSRLRLELGRSGLLKMLGHDHTLEAPLAEGNIEADQAEIGLSRVTLRFEARLLAVVPGTEPEKDIPEVEARMRGPEVLDVDRHPGIVFTSTGVMASPASGPAAAGATAMPGGVHRLRVRGTLEVKGRKAEIEVPLEVRLARDDLVATGGVELSLRDLGLDPPSVAGVVKVANRFKVSFEIHARPAPWSPFALDLER
jgi:polyisoprenoid-binding protein YceI